MSRFCVYGYSFVFSALPPSYRPYNSLLFIISKITVKVKKTALLTGVEVDADILANFVGTKLLTDENAIRYVVGYKRSFGVWMHEQITRLKAALGSKNAKTQVFLDKAARLYHAALAESKNAVRSENGGKKNSIVYLDNGSSYVEASRQVISGNNHDKWISQIKRYFDELLIDSGELDIKTQEGDILTLTKKETKYKAWDSHKTVQGNRVPMDDSEFKVKLRAESHIDELAEASTRNGRELTPDKKNHTFAINGFSYRTAYFHDFDGKYYKVTISVGHNGTKATVYNVAQIKEDTLPTANILAVNGSKAVGKYPLKHSISDSGENVNSFSEKSFSVSEADEFDESIMDTDVNAETLRELKQDAELERYVHRRSKRCGRMPGLLRRFSKKQKRRHICIVFRIELKRVHEIASL